MILSDYIDDLISLEVEGHGGDTVRFTLGHEVVDEFSAEDVLSVSGNYLLIEGAE
jgi:hypothetical protein